MREGRLLRVGGRGKGGKHVVERVGEKGGGRGEERERREGSLFGREG